MNRRAFFNNFGPLMLSGGMIAAGIAIHEPENYTFTGHLTADSPGADNVDYITLNGERIEGVCEFDDVKGWLRTVSYVKGEGLRYQHLKGRVRAYYKEAGKTS